jgi:Ca2+-binding RTX toxin-like protein
VAADDFLDGFAGNDSIYGGGGNDTLRGGAGNDMLDGQAGADNMDGGAGSDSYHVDSALDVVVDSGVTGIDTVFTSIDIYALAAGVENLTLVDASLAAVGHGNGLNNKIVGNAYRNNLEGGDGNDTIFGGGGFDEINGDGGADRLYGDTNRDWLVGGSENDSLYGGADNDTLWGDAGTDRMYGQAGDDEYIGGAGTDVIDVGLGNDRAYHESVLDGRDLLLNFDGNASGGQDVLDISQLFVSLGVAVADRAARVQLVDRGASVDVKVDTNGDGGFDLFAATLQTADMVTVHQDVIVA